MSNRFASLFVAALLPLLLFKWFLANSIGQIDMWLMWLVAMVGVGLPLIYAEIGMAHRSEQLPIQGMQTLTRQADSSMLWRSFAWLTLVLALVMAALSIDATATNVLQVLHTFGFDIGIPEFAFAIGLMVVAGILSLLGSTTLVAAVALVAIAFLVGVISHLSAIDISLTTATFNEWARAVVLALVSVGAGTGLYWFNNPKVMDQGATSLDTPDTGNKKHRVQDIASKTVFPIWLTQVLVGSVLVLFANPTPPAIGSLIYATGVLAAAAYLIHYASKQLALRFNRFGIWIATLLSIVVTAVLVALATPAVLKVILMTTSLIAALVLAIFAGWQMKISHMRKSLNFGKEGIYNIWRIAIRIITPLFIISAIIGFLAT